MEITNQQIKKKLIIAIDGPAGSGKSTTAKLVAKKLNYNYIDTGAMYRALTYHALKNNINSENKNELIKLASNLKISFISNGEEIIVNGINLSKEIREPLISENVSDFSKIAAVRDIMVVKQKELGKDGGVVMEGRDITTIVFPNADLKIFLTADISERAKRRQTELQEKGIGLNINDVQTNLEKRDKIDSSREASPLTLASDAKIIDTTNLTIDKQVEEIFNLVIEKLKNIERINN